MINPEKFFDQLQERKFDFFVGVPDSLLKNLCACIASKSNQRSHIIAANEGNAIGIAAGVHLSTQTIPVVYMQNSGLGNCINPLASLTHPDVYNIPMLMIIGWRGEPDTEDEPQHEVQGKITPDQLKLLGIQYFVMDSSTDTSVLLQQCGHILSERRGPLAILVKKNTFSHYSLSYNPPKTYDLSRERAIEELVKLTCPADLFVSTTGKCSRELNEIRKAKSKKNCDFLTVGSMGHASSIALGVSLGADQRKVICLDGDGAAFMHLGALSIIGSVGPQNLIHVILNNGSHESVGGQPTVGHSVNFRTLASALQYAYICEVSTIRELTKKWGSIYSARGPTMLVINISSSSRPDLTRPDDLPLTNKNLFMSSISDDS